MCASQFGQADTAKVLLENGAVVDLKDKVRIIDMCPLNHHTHTDICRKSALLCGGLVMEITLKL